jgi:hypothetical protein
MDPIREFDRTERVFTGRWYVLVKVYGPAGDCTEVDSETGGPGLRYSVMKQYVPASMCV